MVVITSLLIYTVTVWFLDHMSSASSVTQKLENFSEGGLKYFARNSLTLDKNHSELKFSEHSKDESSSSPVKPIQRLMKLGSNLYESLAMPTHHSPVFEEAPTNVTGIQGATAYLHCLVRNLGNKSVSWIRQRDLHILTVDTYTYTTDQRFVVINRNRSKDWILKIKSAQVRDSGNYECQVSSKSIQSYVVHLSILAPKTTIIGAPDMHVDRGSSINLTCIVDPSPTAGTFIFWYHNNQVINFNLPRGGVTVNKQRNNVTIGYLLIQDAKSTDSGNYSCKPSLTDSTFIRVHVLDGEFPAAMQTSSSSFISGTCLLSVFYNSLLTNYILYIYCKKSRVLLLA